MELNNANFVKYCFHMNITYMQNYNRILQTVKF